MFVNKQICFDKNKSKSLPIVVSKFGGCPDLPKGFQWYYFTWEDPFSHEIKNSPLSFLAQMNCEEIFDNYDLWDECNDFLEKDRYKTSGENLSKLLGYSDNIHYYIKEVDLKNKNFDNTWLILQCS
ncbi:DUF1963 domain-containing protein [Clostridium sp. HBUAS56017]|uniref:DUF1963 domain-containing protein n=1 Tax=Clostridium sp. HBUAS56017 TaxID=2571128 RepID=UPI001A9B6BE9|nr:DUF1963 domain-containing protein [Clostridium sp. HBUAS56017]